MPSTTGTRFDSRNANDATRFADREFLHRRGLHVATAGVARLRRARLFTLERELVRERRRQLHALKGAGVDECHNLRAVDCDPRQCPRKPVSDACASTWPLMMKRSLRHVIGVPASSIESMSSA